MTKRFLVLIHGRNIHLVLEGTLERFGFYTHRFIEAPSATEAKRSALALVSKELRGKVVESRDLDLTVEEIEEVEPSARDPALRQGFTFYKEASDS